MEFYRSEEYRELPDEFNRNIREEPVRESGKKKLLQLLTVCLKMKRPQPLQKHLQLWRTQRMSPQIRQRP